MKLKTKIIINPISGISKKKDIPGLIKQYLSNEKFDWDITFTKYAGNALEIVAKCKKDQYDCIIAVGGDGTINEVAQALINTSIILGIIPMGSGNGLARHCKIPLTPKKSIIFLNHAIPNTIDTVKINGKTFLGIAGFGFDAHISEAFSKSGARGFKTYIYTSIQEYVKYKVLNFELRIDNQAPIIIKPFLFSIANGSQYGNNAIISPLSELNDGQFEVCGVNPFPIWYLPAMILRFFSKNLQHSKYYFSYKGKKAEIKSIQKTPFHIDGEPMQESKNYFAEINPKSLTLLTKKAT